MLNEEIIKKVRIFDFDDTLVKTDSNIYVTHASGKQTTLTPGEYAVYVEKPGDVFDFSDFEKVNKPELIKQNVRMLKQQAKEGKKIVILTARAKYEPIKRFFNELKLTPYVVALGDSNPQKKADYIEDLINKGYNDIAFIDDSLKNVQAVERLRKKYPKVKLVLKHHINEMSGGATMNAQEMARHKKKLAKLKQYLKAQGDDMMEYPKDLPNTVFNAKLLTQEDLRAWFGKGGKGGVGGGGWDRYNSSGDRIGKCGDAKEGEAYSACLSKEKARKLGKAGRAAFVKRKRAAQSKGGDAKKGGERSKGQKPIKVKTGVNEEDLHGRISPAGWWQIHHWDFKPFDRSRNYPPGYFKKNVKEDTTRTSEKGAPGTLKAKITKLYGGPVTIDKAIKLKNRKNATAHDKAQANWFINMQRGKKKNEITGPYGSGYDIVFIREYTPSNPSNIDSAIREIEKLGVRNPLNRDEIIIDDSVVIELRNWDKRLWFSSLYSIVKGQGNASKVMKQITNIADKYKVTIALDPSPFGSDLDKLSRPQLIKFYKKFGFEFEPGEEDFGEMERIAEQMTLFMEKNVPTNPSKWAYAKSQAKKKYDVYPSAYANAWAAKKYKELGGKWRKSEAVLPDEADEEENFSNNRFHNFVSFSGPNPVAGYGGGPR